VSCSTLLLLRAQIRKKVVARSALIAFRAEGLFVHYFEKIYNIADTDAIHIDPCHPKVVATSCVVACLLG
jgi:hypothetical protein